MTKTISTFAVFLLSSTMLSATAPAATPKLTALYLFPTANNDPDGGQPDAEVTELPDGDFVTTTSLGGSGSCYENPGCGAVVLLHSHGHTTKESVIFSFTNTATVGAFPTAGLVQGPDGTLYGTTPAGGGDNDGTVFKLTPDGGNWDYTLLHSFTGANCSGTDDGKNPLGRLAFGSDGYLYGTTYNGGCVAGYNNQGTLFRISTDGSTYGIVHEFNGFANPDADGAAPGAGVTLASDGYFYGTTEQGGSSNGGTVYRFDPSSDAVTLMHSFSDASPDGGLPKSALIEGTDGLLYGTTYTADDGYDPTYGGTLFRISTQSDFALTTLYDFNSAGDNAYIHPEAGVIESSNGRFCGTTSGAVYCIKLSGKKHNVPTLVKMGPLDYAEAAVLQGNDGKLYTTASAGGCDNNGCAGGVYDVTDAGPAPLPSVAWFLPSTVSAGNEVAIAGANFVGATSVVFSGTTASADFSVDASGFLTATVPAGAVSGPVTVTTPAGTATSSVSVIIQ